MVVFGRKIFHWVASTKGNVREWIADALATVWQNGISGRISCWGWSRLTFGLPALSNSHETASPTKPRPATTARIKSIFSQLALLDASRRPNFTVDYWHQHAIRTVIRHLICDGTASAAGCRRVAPFRAASGYLTLSALLTQEQTAGDRSPGGLHPVPFCIFCLGFGLAVAVRAGPQRLS